MPNKDQLTSILNLSGSISFTANAKALSRLQDEWPQLQKLTTDQADIWFLKDRPSVADTRIKVYPTGHIVFYNPEGRRILFTDPQGTPLHECEWTRDPKTGETVLAQARMQLDCRQWVGIKPYSKMFAIDIDVSGQPNWERMTLDDLRQGAAQAWNAQISEVKYFYKDDCFQSQGDGKYHIEIQKDGLYALQDGVFDKTLFISFMFAADWANIDLIPVVELFQSTLPGTGGAAFEMIWGLFEDQSRETPLPPLRYRGLPTYPSPEAFKIFSAFFTPKGPNGQDVMEVFMDTNRSHEITWQPKAEPPWRYFSEEHSASFTVQDRFLYKITVWDDPVGIPFVNGARGARPSCERRLQVRQNGITLLDNGATMQTFPLNPQWNIALDPEPDKSLPSYPFSWKKFFNGSPPEVDPVKTLYTVSFYPDGAAEIQESSLQPMVLDQIIDYMEKDSTMTEKLVKINRVLIHTFDIVIAGCIDCNHPRNYTVLFSDPEFAQKNAQLLWNHAVSKNQLEALENVSFLVEGQHVEAAYQKKYDMIFKWIPFMFYQDQANCQEMLMAAANALEPGGILFLAGPKPISGFFDYFGLECEQSDVIMDVPIFQQHLKMCPENSINPDLTVFLTKKRMG
ncbi:MAG: hypothetical protein VYC17_03550 [Nitrospinota bacterium]|nr:hypothetical protein [Nitrospinota bacterium]